MKCLLSVSSLNMKHMSGTYFVNQQLRHRLFFNGDKIHSEDSLSVLLLLTIQPGSYRPDIGPARILPTIAEYKYVFQRMKRKSDVPIIHKAQLIYDGVIVFVIVSRTPLLVGPEDGR